MTLSDYCTEFKIHLAVLGPNKNPLWEQRYFLWGLRPKLHIAMAPHRTTAKDLDDLMNMALDTDEALQLAEAYSTSTPFTSCATTSGSVGTASSRVSGGTSRSSTSATGGISSSGTRKPITDADRAYLRANNGCF